MFAVSFTSLLTGLSIKLFEFEAQTQNYNTSVLCTEVFSCGLNEVVYACPCFLLL